MHGAYQCTWKDSRGDFHEIQEDEPFMINDLKVNPFTIPHDAAQPVGYRLEHEGHSVGIATDLGKYNDYIIENLQGLDALLLEANMIFVCCRWVNIHII